MVFVNNIFMVIEPFSPLGPGHLFGFTKGENCPYYLALQEAQIILFLLLFNLKHIFPKNIGRNNETRYY